jgi:hypothetical protein
MKYVSSRFTHRHVSNCNTFPNVLLIDTLAITIFKYIMFYCHVSLRFFFFLKKFPFPNVSVTDTLVIDVPFPNVLLIDTLGIEISFPNVLLISTLAIEIPFSNVLLIDTLGIEVPFTHVACDTHVSKCVYFIFHLPTWERSNTLVTFKFYFRFFFFFFLVCFFLKPPN